MGSLLFSKTSLIVSFGGRVRYLLSRSARYSESDNVLELKRRTLICQYHFRAFWGVPILGPQFVLYS